MDEIAQIRRFNRSVTQQIGALENDFLGRDRSLGASRVLFEVGKSGLEIRELRERLGLDSGYVSRLIKSLEAEGLLKISSSDADARVRVLTLTRTGLKELSVLNQLSDESAASLLRLLNKKQCDALIQAMETVEKILLTSNVRINIEEPVSRSAKKCIASYYQELAERFEQGFESSNSIPAEPDELTPPNGYFLIARLYGQPVGCGALKCHSDFGEIKRMWVDVDSRGLGIGGRILQQLEKIAKENNIHLLRLETNQSLTEAQTLYRKHGYYEVASFNEEPYAHHWFEKKL